MERAQRKERYFFGVCVVCLWFSSAVVEIVDYLLHDLSRFKNFIIVTVAKLKSRQRLSFYIKAARLKFVERTSNHRFA